MKNAFRNEVYKLLRNRAVIGVLTGIFIYSLLIQITIPDDLSIKYFYAAGFLSLGCFGMILFWLLAFMITAVVTEDEFHGTTINQYSVGVRAGDVFASKTVVCAAILILVTVELYLSSWIASAVRLSDKLKSIEWNGRLLSDTGLTFLILFLIFCAESTLFTLYGNLTRSRVVAFICCVVISLIEFVAVAYYREGAGIISPFGVMIKFLNKDRFGIENINVSWCITFLSVWTAAFMIINRVTVRINRNR